MNFLVVCVIVSSFYVPVADTVTESLEECSMYAEIYINETDEDYLELLNDLYSDVQADRLTPETRKGCDSQNSMETLREISEEGTPPDCETSSHFGQ